MGDLSDDLALERRSGLPDALRVLLAEYPREMWEGDPAFSGLIRFWLDRHQMFRDLCARMVSDAQGMLEGRMAPQRYGASLSRFGGMFVGELHMHHTVEDTQYFPTLSRHDVRLTRGFSLLDADHHALDARLAAFTDAANAVLQAPEAARHDPAGAFLAEVDAFAPLLARHLEDEEDLIVPVLLRYGASGLG